MNKLVEELLMENESDHVLYLKDRLKDWEDKLDAQKELLDKEHDIHKRNDIEMKIKNINYAIREVKQDISDR